MKKALLPLLCFAVCFASCDKSTNDRCARVGTTAPSSEVFTLQSYLSSNGINAVSDERGFFYIINSPGSDLHPSVCSNVTVTYTGRLTNGAQFDARNGEPFSLSGVIAGWQEGVPLIGKGGSITLYLPPSLGYGSQAQTGVPANSILVFQIDLVDVQ